MCQTRESSINISLNLSRVSISKSSTCRASCPLPSNFSVSFKYSFFNSSNFIGFLCSQLCLYPQLEQDLIHSFCFSKPLNLSIFDFFFL
uniref:Uncharacterized protein n=1 Tax=uncultured marine virus TaxID=186617 RepID=A0A0F7L7P8_9VIRU|nr:hypothetical protein [uncultured marine virus]